MLNDPHTMARKHSTAFFGSSRYMNEHTKSRQNLDNQKEGNFVGVKVILVHILTLLNSNTAVTCSYVHMLFLRSSEMPCWAVPCRLEPGGLFPMRHRLVSHRGDGELYLLR